MAKISNDMAELLVLIALKYGEISEAKGIELLGWSPDRIQKAMVARVGRSTTLEYLEAENDRLQARNFVLEARQKDLDKIAEHCRALLNLTPKENR